MVAGGKKDKNNKSAGKRRKSLMSAVAMNRDASLAASSYMLTGDLAVDLPAVTQEMGVEFTPAVQLVVLAPLTSSPAGDVESPPPPELTQLQAITERYEFYQPRVRLQVRGDVVQRDSESGQLGSAAHGVQVAGWRCEAEHLTAMRRCFSAMEALSTLSLNNAALDEPAVAALVALLADRPTVTTLNLDSNPGIGTQVTRLLAPPANVLSLSLRNCCVTDEQLAELQPILSELNTHTELRYTCLPLRSLNLGNNRLTDAGAVTLATILRSNRQLRLIGLTRNHIGTKGALALAAVLQPFAMTHEEVVVSRRARAEARRVLVARVESELKGRGSCCAGKCTHTSRRSEPDTGDGRISPAGSLRSSGQRTGSRSGRSPAKLAAPVAPAAPRGSDAHPVQTIRESVESLMSSVVHPLMTLVRPENGRRLNPGNLSLASLSLAYNPGIHRAAATAFLEALRYQESVPAEEQARLGPGLLRLCLTGTPADGDPQLAPPAEDEEKKTGRAGRQSQLALDASRRTASRVGKKKKLK
ncbi:leucine-rich repeat-containing protein 71-like [Amphibalanus amphitrite]|uniref:leucine-rich repeat-containing protein 71-like n=1 Tax=Amphibalanus amphitrite TaxID=1232801 RepID=UPI001C927312|nr:leucine-rich repeat-containing protein 71-like [Amphibalanus amphitrite]